MIKTRRLWLFIFLWCFALSAEAQKAENSSLPFDMSIENIMRDSKWIGSSPSGIFWSESSEKLYFSWNPENAESDSLYVCSKSGGQLRKVTKKERDSLPGRSGVYNHKRTVKLYVQNSDIFLFDITRGQITQLTNTLERESNPYFSKDESRIIFMRDNNLYSWDRKKDVLIQLTDFRTGRERTQNQERQSEQEKWLQQEELKLIQVLRERRERSEQRRGMRQEDTSERPKTIYTNNKRVQSIQLCPNERFVTYSLYTPVQGTKNTIVPNYVTETGFTTDINARSKVGGALGTYEFFVYDTMQDTVIKVNVKDVPGIYDEQEYLQNYRKKPADETQADSSGEKKTEKRKPRSVAISGPIWSEDGNYAVVILTSQDNKDRWIMLLDPSNGTLKLLDRQHDEAWIGGPGINSRNVGWMPDNRSIWFQSEESGYSHLYTLDVSTGKKTALTSGQYEIYSPQISQDKKYWYFSSNKVHPGERHFYRMPINGGEAVQITSKTGSNQVTISPDEKTLAISFSYSNIPWELYIMENKPGANAVRITQSLSEEFLSYPWREPAIITFNARDGATVYARLYRPDNPAEHGPAVIFVHGAGYLQNAHKWWSSYYHEYMFNNLLVDNGYTVLDIDYRGSAGYGRDWRTGIYRYMGDKDLTDHVDGAQFLVDNYDVDPRRIGIYGGSYGGFITLMAMFTQPDVFAAGAALRPVTDWAHYNHGYTSDILNVPYADSLAYVRSSPIYHAGGLKGALLICHGMVDANVHFQDVVRLAQRLIELGKDNWELAVYPVEGHGFREPSSWTDEYKRIFQLFEDNLSWPINK